MKACPVCSVDLARTDYEGFPVFKCGQCSGYLIANRRIEGIKRTRDRPSTELMQEAEAEAAQDSEERLRCPDCKARMRKKSLPQPAQFKLDVCEACELVWFDGGELAAIQLYYENSAKGRQQAQYQKRMASLTPSDQDRLQKQIDKLPEKDDTDILSMLCTGFVEGMFRRRGPWGRFF